MNAFVLPLSDREATLERTGGKGMSLAKMAAAGLPVPGGFHVTTEAYRRFVAVNEIQPRIRSELLDISDLDPAALEQAASRIRSYFTAGSTPPEISTAIAQAYQALEGAPVAVRSSATAEDLPSASFAGQQETFLNVSGTEAVLEAVKNCWASLWTARAIAYRMQNGIDQENVALAVVVQEMVSADAAGILFTANPVNGKRSEIVINAAWGLGEAVVSGAVTPDTLRVDKATGRILEREIAEKLVMTVRSEQGTFEQPVPAARQKQAVLNAAQAAELSRLGVKIEELYQGPMDVEWALANNRFYILQARPITALPPEWKQPDPQANYTRGSLAEHTPSPVSPLFATFGLDIANQATFKVWERFMGRSARDLVPEGGIYQTVNGYVYLGIRLGGLRWLNLMKMTITGIKPILSGSVKRWQEAHEEFAAVVEKEARLDLQALSPGQLLEAAERVFSAACRYYTVIQTTLPAASMSELLFNKMYARIQRRGKDPDALTFLLGFDSAALRAEKSLYDTAEWVRTQPALARYVVSSTTTALEADLLREDAPAGIPEGVWSEWRRRIAEHLEVHGRTAYDFDFANPTPQETPGAALDTVKAFLEGKAENPYERQQRYIEARQHAEAAVLGRLRAPVRGLFEKLLRWAQETGPMREDSIFDMGMGHPLLRRIFGELGRRFAAGEVVEKADDIYWLEKREVEDLTGALERQASLPDMREHVAKRKETWMTFRRAAPPVMLPETSKLSRFIPGGKPEKIEGKMVLKGIGTSGGVVKAPARVLFSPEDFDQMKPGDVLVAVTTTPAWTPLFARASAVVTDIGGPLSHSSIVAREYGIPAVMAAQNATRLVRSGQIITVDGNTGTVTLDE